MGDQFCAVFSSVPNAIVAAREAQGAMASQDWSDVDGLEVRMAIHAGAVEVRDGDYFGRPLNKVARLLAAAHGGQVLLSGAAADLIFEQIPEGISLTDLGQHRLKDLEGVEHVYQLVAPELRADFPRLRSLEEFPNNLPLQLTSFVGHADDLKNLRSIMKTTRLVSLVGTGGVGKTRVALQLAAELVQHYFDGVWLIDLSLIKDAAAVAAEVASILSIRATAGQDVTQSVIQTIGDKRVLLIFDGCEQVLPTVSALIDAILHACPSASVIATSRHALDIAGGVVYNVETLDPDSAAQLFCERARSASNRLSFTGDNAAIVASICRRLDGIPLALELAAVKTSVLNLKQLSEKLEERFRLLAQTGTNRLPRQQTLRALIDWSFDLLDENERTMFARLSVFAGGWSLPAAAAVCEDEGIDEWAVFELLSSLVLKSLVVAETFGDDQRYSMLNSIREYARERLTQSGDSLDVSSRHAHYFAEFVRDLNPLVDALEDVRWQRAFAPEIDNVRAAVDWTIVRGHEPPAGIALLSNIEWPELVTTPQEAFKWFDAALPFIDEVDDVVVKARVMRLYVRLLWFVGRPISQRETSAIKSLEIARASNDPSELAWALANLGSVYRDAARYEEADRCFSEAYRVPETLSAIATNTVLRNWAVTDLQRGDLELARRRFTDVARLERPGSEAHASALLNLGELEFATGDLEAARERARQAKEVFESLNAAPLGLVLCNLSAYALAADKLDEARTYLREAIERLEQSGAGWMIAALEHLAVLAGLEGNIEQATLLVGFTCAQYAAQGKARERTERYGYERLMHLLDNAFDSEELAHRMSVGARFTGEQAMAQAVAISKDVQPVPASRAAE